VSARCCLLMVRGTARRAPPSACRPGSSPSARWCRVCTGQPVVWQHQPTPARARAGNGQLEPSVSLLGGPPRHFAGLEQSGKTTIRLSAQLGPMGQDGTARSYRRGLVRGRLVERAVDLTLRYVVLGYIVWRPRDRATPSLRWLQSHGSSLLSATPPFRRHEGP
jgi:hypothetical protein